MASSEGLEYLACKMCSSVFPLEVEVLALKLHIVAEHERERYAARGLESD